MKPLNSDQSESGDSTRKTISIIDLKSSDIEQSTKLAVDCLKMGGVIAIPTDTIYGIAALANNTESVKRIYDIKGNFKCRFVIFLK